jgi:hypothetical protein
VSEARNKVKHRPSCADHNNTQGNFRQVHVLMYAYVFISKDSKAKVNAYKKIKAKDGHSSNPSDAACVAST